MALAPAYMPPHDAEEDELVLGRYRVLDEAGSGGFATVRLAWDTRMQRRVAVKEIDLSPLAARAGQPINGVEDLPESSLTGLDEARTAAMLANPNIVAVHDFEVRDNTAYIIMEYVDGATLTSLLGFMGDNIGVDMVTAAFDGIAAALRYAHENQVLHLDIKPDNVMIDHQGQVKVMDFGLARLSGAHGFESAAGGTIGYMPPEQIMREPLDGRCDEWALASLTYEMISGSNPFLAKDLSAALDRIEGAELVLPSLCMEGLPAEIDDVMFYALDPDRFKRYATVADFAEEMDRFLGDAANGRRQLAACVRAMLDEGEEPIVENVGRTRPRLRGGSRVRGAIRRGLAAAGAGVLAAAGLTSISALGGWTSPWCWGGTLAVAALAAISPRRAGILGPAAIAAALFAGGAYLLGAAFAAAGLAWWLGIGVKDDACAAGGLSEGLVGAAGIGPLAPLLCGYLAPPGRAAGNALFAATLAFVLGACGSQGLMGWTAPIGTVDGPAVQQAALALALDPTTWTVAGSWMFAAVLCAACGRRGTLRGQVLGMALGAAVLVGAAFLAGWLEAGQTAPFGPSLALLVPAVIAAVAGIAVVAGMNRLTPDTPTSRGFE